MGPGAGEFIELRRVFKSQVPSVRKVGTCSEASLINCSQPLEQPQLREQR